MLFFIGRSTTRQLASTAFATSSARSAVFRTTAKPQFQSFDNYRRSAHRATRSFASVGRPKKASTLEGAESSSTKKPAKKSTKATQAKVKATAKAKPVPKPKPVRKTITKEQKAVLERRALKEAALYTEPKPLPDNAWQLFVVESTKGKTDGQSGLQKMPLLAQAFKELSSYETEVRS
jgi:hypothetical protein